MRSGVGEALGDEGHDLSFGGSEAGPSVAGPFALASGSASVGVDVMAAESVDGIQAV